MKIAEQAALKQYVEQLDQACLSYKSGDEFYQNIASVKDFSLQEIAFNNDMEFLNEAQKVLNVVSSIISHPHISNKREEIVIRIEQAQQLQSDVFQRVLQDSSLWKEHNGQMIPEYVYYHQYVDELCIYENRFIVMLVDIIGGELIKLHKFYLDRLPQVTAGKRVEYCTPPGMLPPVAIKKIDLLRRKLRFIKNTFFYKEVSKAQKITGTIKPTNILVKDRLYRVCYKFYRRFVRYEDQSTLRVDLAKYCSVMILKAIGRMGFELKSVTASKYYLPRGILRKLMKRSHTVTNFIDGDASQVEKPAFKEGYMYAPFFNGCGFIFENELFTLETGWVDGANGLCIDVTYKNLGLVKSHMLVFSDLDVSTTFKMYGNDFASLEMFSVWEHSVIENGVNRVIGGHFTEMQMVENWVLSKLTTLVGDKDIYSVYCPVCKNKGVNENGGLYDCPVCSAQYVMDSNNGKDDQSLVWLCNIRR